MNSETVTNCPHCSAPVTASPAGFVLKLLAAAHRGQAGQSPSRVRRRALQPLQQRCNWKLSSSARHGHGLQSAPTQADRFVALKLLPKNLA